MRKRNLVPYWGRSRLNLGFASPSTRAFGHVPLTGEVDKPRRKEHTPVAQEVVTNEQSANQQPRCELATPSYSGWRTTPRLCLAKCSRWTSGWKASTVRPTSWASGEQSTIER